jgi:putative ubiquitin-RnfH superfamily antitoxin RatB of RatAB toxin-antitoxin module
VLYSPAAREVLAFDLQLPLGVRVRDALHASGLAERCPELDLGHASVGVWGRKAGLEQVLRDLDRVEVYRPLRVDPKVARRERFKRQGARGTGLFARKRAGAKTGY